MARIRSIKPEFFTSVPVSNLTRDARLLFIGLWTHVDDEGRAVDDPRLFKAAVFPLDDDLPARKVEALVSELEAKGRIIRYQVDGRSYLVVRGWEHQKIDRKSPSRLPPPPGSPCEPSTNGRRGLDESSTSPRPLIYGSMDQGSMEPAPESSTNPRRGEPPGFAEFWTAYPRKAAKAKALAAYAKAIRSGVTVEQLIEAIKAQRLPEKAANGEMQYVPHPSTWLNQERWTDLPEHVAPVTPIRADLNEIVIGADGVAMSLHTIGRM